MKTRIATLVFAMLFISSSRGYAISERGPCILPSKAHSAKTLFEEAENGNPSAQVNVSQMFLDGDGLLEDSLCAAYWLRCAHINSKGKDGNRKRLQLLNNNIPLKYQAELNRYICPIGQDKLVMAITNKNTDLVLDLLNAGANPNKGTYLGDNDLPLTIAVENGSLSIVKILIESFQVDINAPVSVYGSNLNLAYGNEKWEITRYLIENGANPNIRYDDGTTIMCEDTFESDPPEFKRIRELLERNGAKCLTPPLILKN